MAFPSRGLAVSAAIHGAILLGLLLVWPRTKEAETSPVPAAVAVSLAAAGGAPATAPTDVREELSASETLETLSEAEPEEIEALEAAPEPVEAPEPMEAIPAVPAENATVAAPPEVVPTTEPPPEATKAQETEAPARSDTEVVEAEPAPPKQTADSAVPAAGSANAGAAASAGSTASTASVTAGMTSYAAVLRAWLRDHMRYPRRAKLRNMQGTATLWLSIDPEGHVLDFRIERSSGYSILDSEVEDLVRRADPMPPVPETMQDTSIEFVVPVQFVLR